ncbi:MAG TPA: glycosyl hydrolase [Lachnospiraceae bacterium]|nr:glycosyl hydrolase [Lachnospiraceae bacterium]
MENRESCRKKAEELVGRMTVEEAASQLLHQSPAIERLDIPEYNWWSEGLHGVARAGIATVFPQAIGMAAAFDDDFLEKEAEVIATEARAKYNAAKRHGDRDIYKGLTYWSPNINIFRDPRWGRGHETYGEDPVLTGRLGKAFIKGLQQKDEKGYLKIAACAKHFAVHSGPEALRHGFDVTPTEKDLNETYLPAFKEAVRDGEVEAVMTAYNSVFGEPCCANDRLINRILKEEWGFEGHIVSDCWAVKDMHGDHHFTKTPEESAALAVRRGCDLNCGCTYENLIFALNDGLITEEEIRSAAVRVFTTRFLLGMFDADCSYEKIPYCVVNCREHQELAVRAAENSAVLLKNDGILPLDRSKLKSIAVIGPNAYSAKALYGNYNGDSGHFCTNLDGIREAAGDDIRIYYSKGCDIFEEQEDPLAKPGKYLSEAEEIASISDVTILCVGLDADLEGEEGDTGNAFASGDKPDLLLTASQRRLCDRITALGKPLIIVINSGSALDLSAWEDKAGAVLQAWYSGESGGKALAEILFGDISPSGKLPVTFYYNDQKLPEFTDYHMKGRTYKFLEEKPWYPFGYGLSYSEFSYSGLKAETDGEELALTVSLKNTGSFDATEIAEIYIRYEGEAFEKPVHYLADFRSVRLLKGEEACIGFTIKKDSFASFAENGERKLLSGSYTVFAGGSQPDERSLELTHTEPLRVTVTIGEDQKLSVN